MKRDQETVSFDIPAELVARLAALGENKGRDADRVARRIVLDYLEDMEDIARAEKILDDVKSGREETVPWEEIRAEILSDVAG